MLVPRVLYGPYTRANQRAKDWILRRVTNSDPPTEAAGQVVDSKRASGLFLLNIPTAILREESNFHCYLPMQHLKAAITRGKVDDIFEDRCFSTWLTEPWSLIGLLAQINVMWFAKPDRYRPFLDAILNDWTTLEGEGARYTIGSVHGQDLWSVNSNLKYVLANMAIPAKLLTAPLPPEGLKAFVEMTKDWDGKPAIDGE